MALGAKFESNSWGGPEGPSQIAADVHFNHPGVAITASSGDSGFGAEYPAASQYITSVGGTSLVTATNSRGWDETVWSGAGSGCSAFDPKPAFQTDTGCANRTVADVSAVADPATGPAVYNSFSDVGWNVYGGTSVSSPIIASVYALAGDPAPGSSPNSYPYDAGTGLNDVTSGSNGACGGTYLCTAGPGYDGPTGLGTPVGVQAFKAAPHGVLTGTVTDAGTGGPLPGALVTAGVKHTVTDAAGHYVIAVPPGTYDVSAAAFGYATATTSGVVVTEGATTTVDAALTAVPRVTLSGTVKDGSGHNWPLYATINLAGVPGGPIFTDPVTGRYQVTVPSGASYAMHVTANYPGYLPTDQTVTVGSANVSADVQVLVDPLTCAAPGYAVHVTGLSENFDANTQPAGWSVVNNTAVGGWNFTDDGGRGNLSGGSGGFAMIDSDHLGIGNTEDTFLVTPVVDFTGQANPVIGFNSDYRALSSVADVDLSTDGGTTWNTVLHQTASARGPLLLQVPIPQAANQSAVQVRFHYTGTWAWWWEIDNVFVGNRACDPVAGGLVLGTVSDHNTNAGVNGATVSSVDKPAETAVSSPTPDDPNLGDGFYWMFSSVTGSHAFSAARGGYQGQTVTANVQADFTTAVNFSLGAGRLSITPPTVAKTVKLGGSTTATVTVKNTGTASATATLGEQDNGFAILAASVPGAPLTMIKGSYGPSSLKLSTSRKAMMARTAAPAATPYAAPWTDVANLNTPVMDNFAAFDAGKLYSLGGTDGISVLASGAVRDPLTGAWSPIASMATRRASPAGGFINGKLYVVGGWGTGGSPEPSLEIYDPASNTWSAGASAPAAFAASAAAVLGGKLYLVGGCDTNNCGFATVTVYDPASNTWSTAANYPQSTSWEACGALAGQVYCAGGTTDAGDTTKGYAYNPGTNTWTAIADLPIDLWAMGYTAADGVLLVSGGVTAGTSTLTNQGFMFDPGTGTWTAIANSNNTVYRGGSACGFYKVGGSTGGFNPVANAEVLPGFDQCGTAADVTWLSESPTSLTVAPGTSVTVTLKLDAAASVVTQPGDYKAKVTFTSDTPYQVAPVDVTMTVSPPRTWGKVAGTVTGVACNGTSAPIAGATVQIDTWAAHYTLKTDASGRYALWLDKRNNPLQMIVAKDGWQPQTRIVRIRALQTTTADWALKTAAICP